MQRPRSSVLMNDTPASGGPPSEAAPPELKRLPILLRRAWCSLNQGLRDRIEHLGITPFQFSILRWLSESDPEGLSQRTLADLMASDANTISSTLSRMETRRLITRVKNERDHRASRVRLGPAGWAKFERARSIALSLQEQALVALPESGRAKFLEDLETIADACASASEKSGPGRIRSYRAKEAVAVDRIPAPAST
jgi:DNA-binding MarR family transcriptional regulator